MSDFVNELQESYCGYNLLLDKVIKICYNIFKVDNIDIEYSHYNNGLTIKLPRVIFEQKTHNDFKPLWDLGFQTISLVEKKVTTFRKEFTNNVKEENDC